jgi:hypothetical protein
MALLDTVRAEVAALKASNDALTAEVAAVAARVAALQTVSAAEVANLEGQLHGETVRVSNAVTALRAVAPAAPVPVP